MKEYHKIDGLYQRDENKHLMPGVYRNPMVDFLKDCTWEFTEKIDGTNIRVFWDGHSVSFAGRTDRADIPGRLRLRLEELFSGYVNEQVFEQSFGDKEVTLYGEGYGAKIQNGGNYIPYGNDFILFDVEVNGVFLDRINVNSIASRFGIDSVPVVLTGTIADAEKFVQSHPDSTIGTAKMEGVVGRPIMECYDKNGKRTIVKVKVRDFDEICKYAGGIV